MQLLDSVSGPTENDWDIAKEKAITLLKNILPKREWREFKKTGFVNVVGVKNAYSIIPFGQTTVKDLKSNKILAYSCLQLSVPAPTYDRMIAEYLLITNDENLYLKTVNLFEVRTRFGGFCGILFGIVFVVSFYAVLIYFLLSWIFGRL